MKGYIATVLLIAFITILFIYHEDINSLIWTGLLKEEAIKQGWRW